MALRIISFRVTTNQNVMQKTALFAAEVTVMPVVVVQWHMMCSQAMQHCHQLLVLQCSTHASCKHTMLLLRNDSG
jgi:hypothetical protein